MKTYYGVGAIQLTVNHVDDKTPRKPAWFQPACGNRRHVFAPLSTRFPVLVENMERHYPSTDKCTKKWRLGVSALDSNYNYKETT